MFSPVRAETDISDITEVTDKVVNELIQNSIIQDNGIEVFDKDEQFPKIGECVANRKDIKKQTFWGMVSWSGKSFKIQMTLKIC